MSDFRPSTYGDIAGVYGEAGTDVDLDSDEQGQSPSELLEQYAPAISTLLFGGETREKYEQKLANLESWKQAYAQASSQWVKNALAMKIRNLKGQIKALEEVAGEERSAVRSTQILKWSGITLLAGFGLLGITSAFLMVQKASTEKAKRAQLKMIVE
jgi:hypothetical protein